MSDEAISEQLQLYLDQLRDGDQTVYAALWDLVNDRLTVLARKMKRGPYRRVGSWEQTEDIAQNARVRLIRAVQSQVPATPRDFFRLANLQIRRELLDTIRAHTGRRGNRTPPTGITADVHSDDDSFDPEKLASWQEFHNYVETLPEQQREVVELLWYQSLSHEEAAKIIKVDKSTVRRRWEEIRPKLAKVLPEPEAEQPDV